MRQIAYVVFPVPLAVAFEQVVVNGEVVVDKVGLQKVAHVFYRHPDVL